jgi:hypothetical protein
MRPIQFSTLKALDPLQNEEEHAETHESQDDIKHVRHGSLPRRNQVPAARLPARHIRDTWEQAGKIVSMRHPCAAPTAPNRTHAPSPRHAHVTQAATTANPA